MEGLTPGRDVHYVAASGEHLAAKVSRVQDAEAGFVTLRVFNPDARGSYAVQGALNIDPPVEVRSGVPFSAEPMTYHWHWIERA